MAVLALSGTLLSACTSTNLSPTGATTATRTPSPGTPAGSAASRNVYGALVFGGADRLLTNEYAHWNPTAPDAVSSPVWDMTSGSLFVRNGVGYSGRPDRRTVDARSTSGTNSAVFRLVTKNRTYKDVRFAMRFRLLRFTGGEASRDDWDGLHLWLRYHDETQMYVASLARRDGRTAVKRKDPGGESNGGTYTLLASAPAAVSLQEWHTAVVTARDITHEGRDAVRVTVEVDGATTLDVLDEGGTGTPLRTPGGVGVRADNCEFEFTDVVVGPPR
ncbi:MAG: hypothetical protein IPI32_11095 [Austwickia sp.]|nr:hypothetical protein [Austwickia sp.]